jgi:DNA-binding transcriptional regulator LsrR (DeoR family)
MLTFTRLSVAVVIPSFSDGKFTQRAIGRRLGVADNLVEKPLKRLRSLGLVKSTGDQMQRNDTTSFWIAEVAPIKEFVSADLR